MAFTTNVDPDDASNCPVTVSSYSLTTQPTGSTISPVSVTVDGASIEVPID